MRLTLKSINDELKRRGHTARLDKGDAYFYFSSGEANGWLDRTVNVPRVSSLTLDQWMEEFNRLTRLNHEMLSGQFGKTKQTQFKPGKKTSPKNRASSG